MYQDSFVSHKPYPSHLSDPEPHLSDHMNTPPHSDETLFSPTRVQPESLFNSVHVPVLARLLDIHVHVGRRPIFRSPLTDYATILVNAPPPSVIAIPPPSCRRCLCTTYLSIASPGSSAFGPLELRGPELVAERLSRLPSNSTEH